ncbi:phytanoyl dioxygenase, putative [Babesia ovata]|uniref:Phytanoyl dioxygenase, putative n=1 Tax=Babesia ovata TaxID=189622 RepID=A0A2H6KGM1_9APIC|nr:phytanoyl dioxygenase, putative [Babesia ovata]GBE62150.1 phytanoyl dioxygenase, putative [Babesia ovata]
MEFCGYTSVPKKGAQAQPLQCHGLVADGTHEHVGDVTCKVAVVNRLHQAFDAYRHADRWNAPSGEYTDQTVVPAARADGADGGTSEHSFENDTSVVVQPSSEAEIEGELVCCDAVRR